MLQAPESCFAPSYYNDHQGAIFKLQQRGTINDHLNEFEMFTNRIVVLAPLFLLSCFISGLNPKLCREVQAFQPLSLPQAVAFTKLQEDKINDRRCSLFSSNHNSPMATILPSTSSKLPFKRLTLEEIIVCQDKGLCYYCEEKWTTGHRCKPRIHLFIADDDIYPFPSPSSLTIDSAPPSPPLISSSKTPLLSLNAMTSMPALETFHVYGVINHQRMTILVDGGSTHNFVQTSVEKFLGLPSSGDGG